MFGCLGCHAEDGHAFIDNNDDDDNDNDNEYKDDDDDDDNKVDNYYNNGAAGGTDDDDDDNNANDQTVVLGGILILNVLYMCWQWWCTTSTAGCNTSMAARLILSSLATMATMDSALCQWQVKQSFCLKRSHPQNCSTSIQDALVTPSPGEQLPSSDLIGGST